MSKIKDVLTQSPTSEQHAMADFLLSMCPSEGFLLKHADKLRYITLDEQVGKSKNNKNAVSILKIHTSFMVPDWSFSSKAKSIGLDYKEIDKAKVGKRLAFPRLKIETINETPGAIAYFKDLLIVAKQEAQRRQTIRQDVSRGSIGHA